MSEYDAETYENFAGHVRRQVQSLRVIIDSLQVNMLTFIYILQECSWFYVFSRLLHNYN
jgi:hypothetical protein